MLFHPFTHDGRIFTKLQKRGVICAAKPERRVANEGVWVWWELVRGLGRSREWERHGKRKSDGKGKDFRKRGDGKKKVERLLLVRAEFRIILGKSHSIYLQVAPLSSLSLPSSTILLHAKCIILPEAWQAFQKGKTSCLSFLEFLNTWFPSCVYDWQYVPPHIVQGEYILKDLFKKDSYFSLQ